MNDYTIEVSDPIVTDAGTFRVRVEYDLDGVDPRDDFDQLGTMVCPTNSHYAWPREGDLVARIEDAFERGGPRLAVRYLSVVHGAVVLPVYGGGDYDRMRAGELGVAVDNGERVSGVIYALRRDVAAQWEGHPMPSDHRIAEWLASEVATYATWANGEMTGYVIEQTTCCAPDMHDDDCEWQEISSCWGYFSVDEAMAQGRQEVPTEPERHAPEWSYHRSEIGKTGDAESYRLKITSDGGASRWMTISKSQRDRIADILAEED